MHVDSRNPVVYYSVLQVTANNDKYAFNFLRNTDIDAYSIKLITSVMYIDRFDVQCYEDQYVALKDYESLRAKLENLERKHAKLKRRHERVGLSLMISRRMKKLFEIQHGTVYKDGDAIILFCSPLSSIIEENKQIAIPIINSVQYVLRKSI